MNKIPFDIEKALAGYQVVTRTGEKVEDWHYFKKYKNPYIINFYLNSSNDLHSATKTGHVLLSEESDRDLFLLPKKKAYCVSIMKRVDNGQIYTCQARDSIEACEDNEKRFGNTHELITRLFFDVEE